MNKKTNKIFQLIIVICFLAISYLAVIQANYAMIYFVKAKILSILSIVICLHGFLIQAFVREQLVYKGTFEDNKILKIILFPLENSQKLIWIGLSIYTLNIWFILIVTFLSSAISNYFFGNEEMLKWSNTPNSSKKAMEKPGLKINKWAFLKESFKRNHLLNMLQNESLYALLIVFLFTWMDTIREYSIWHEFEIRMFPMISLSIAIVIAISGLVLPKKQV